VTKLPVNPHDGALASVADSNTWGLYEEAVGCARRRRFPGVGYVLDEHDDLTGGDLDDCLNEFGIPEPWAREVIELAETYAETSPSGHGVRLLWRGKIESAVVCRLSRVEIYGRGRYLTITGKHIKGTPEEICEAPLTLKALIERVARAKEKAKREKEEAEGRSRKSEPGKPEGDSFWRAVNDAAMSSLGQWVPELFGSKVKRTNEGGYRVSSAELGRDLEEDLSISPKGIKDFGVHDLGDPNKGKRTPLDIVKEFGGRASAKDAEVDSVSQQAQQPQTKEQP